MGNSLNTPDEVVIRNTCFVRDLKVMLDSDLSKL